MHSAPSLLLLVVCVSTGLLLLLQPSNSLNIHKKRVLAVSQVYAIEPKEAGTSDKTCKLGSPDNAKWAPINEYDKFFTAAAAEFGVDGNLLKAMAMIESGGAGHAPGGKVLERDDGFGDGLSVGIMQVKPSIWQYLVPDADPYDAQGNIRLGAALMAKSIKEQGSWEKAITNVYFPSNDPNGTTQQKYVDTVKQYLQELGGAGDCANNTNVTPGPGQGKTTDESSCVITKVGDPKVSPTIPPSCGAAAGDYHNPLAKPEEIETLNNIVTAINVEMGAYPLFGNQQGSFGGHYEHAGLDIMTNPGNHGPVYAITDGVVESIMSGNTSVEIGSCTSIGEGCTIRIKHGNDKFTSAYVHTDPIVETGEKVKRGQVIANVHRWGNPSMDHLHFELRLTENNYNINPRIYFPELEQFPIASGYNGDVRKHSATVQIFLEEGGNWAEKFRDHPPCPNKEPGYCWAM
jgi:murein DD-endopeptidase MepM/ murein hydrolase activator NlpD